MTDKGYDNPPRTNGHGGHENGALNGRDADTALMLLDTSPVPMADMAEDGDAGHESEPGGGREEAQARAPGAGQQRGDPDPADAPDSVQSTDELSVQVADDGAEEVPQAEAPEFTDEERRRHLRMGEALLFASAEPLRTEQIAERLPDGADVEQVLADLAGHYAERGVNLVRVAGGWAFRTATDLAFLMERERVEQRKLSRAALETLAIIAYHQPVTRAEIEDVRGVSVSKGTLDVLMEIGWVRVRGRRQTPGRPVTYGTTDFFLEHFGLDRIGDLPGLDELKAAGLLDTRMPTNIHIPRPSDEDEPAEAGLEEGEDTDLGYSPRNEDEDSAASGADEAPAEPEPAGGDDLDTDESPSWTAPEQELSAWEGDEEAAEADFAQEEFAEESAGGVSDELEPEAADAGQADPEQDSSRPDEAPSEAEPSGAEEAAGDEDFRTTG